MICKSVAGPALTVAESDGTPTVGGVRVIRVGNGALTDLGGGSVKLSAPTDIDGGSFADTYVNTADIDGGAFV